MKTRLEILAVLVVCAIVSVIATFALFAWNAPVESPGYAKAVAMFWPIVAFVLFGLIWPLTIFGLIVFRQVGGSIESRVRGSEASVFLAIAGVLFLHSVYRIYPLAADEIKKRRLLNLTTAPNIDEKSSATFVDDYLTATKNGALDGGFRQQPFVALLRNPSAPPEILARVGMKLSNDSYLWQFLAGNPTLPRSVIEAKIGVPMIAVYFGMNPRVPAEFLKQLAASPNHNLRTVAARNVATPRESLELLTKDHDSLIRDFALQNLAGTLGTFAYK